MSDASQEAHPAPVAGIGALLGSRARASPRDSAMQRLRPILVSAVATLSALPVDGLRLEPVSGRGKVFSFVIFHRVYHPAFAEEVPYVVALVELDEGPRLLTNIVGVPPEEVRLRHAG